MNDDNELPRLADVDAPHARSLLIGTILSTLFSTVVLVGLIVLMFSLGGFFSGVGWVLVVFLALWDWRGLRQIVKLSRGDLSL